MRRKPFRHSRRSSLAATDLVRVAKILAESGSRIEDDFWTDRLTELVGKALTAKDNGSISQALDQLYDVETRAYDQLADVVEATAESMRGVTIGKERLDGVLVSVPILAWSRYEIPARTIPENILAALRVQLQAHVFAADVRFAIADHLFSPDQLPAGYAETRELADDLWAAAVAGTPVRVDPHDLPESQHFIADARYVLAGVVVPAGGPVFRWQENVGTETTRDAVLAVWKTQGLAAITPLLPACGCDVVLPDAFHAGWRRTERDLRPFSLRAAVLFLTATLRENAGSLRAIAAPFYDRVLEEYRIAFTRKDTEAVVHGVVWPLVGAEDELTDTAEQISTVLRDSGLHEVTMLEQRFPLEFCDDCGAPLFPNPDGEAVHAELPDSADESRASLH